MDRGQLIFFGGAALFILYKAIKGWRLGIVRQLIELGALAAAYLTGLFLGGTVTPLLRGTGFPDFVLHPLGALCVGLVAYFAIGMAGRILFKKTSEQEFGLVWLFYGLSGALLGAVFGLLFVFIAALGIRFLGTLATGAAIRPAALPEVESQPGSLHAAQPSAQAPPSATVSGLIGLKHSLEQGIPGEVLQTLDPIPQKAYDTVEKIGRTASSPEAIARFFSFPGASELAQRPEIISLRDDPEIVHALREGKYLALLKNQRLVKAANSPKVAELIKKFDLEKALDFATRAAPSPATHPQPVQPSPAP